MRTLSTALAIEQVRLSRHPLVQLDVATYGHPAAPVDSAHQWSAFRWERLTSPADATAPAPHAIAIPADGSVNRVRVSAGNLFHQRVAYPGSGSNWTAAWSNMGAVVGNPTAIIAVGAEVMVFASDGVNLARRQSGDNGATWSAWIIMNNARPLERGVAAAYKSNGDCAVVHASDFNDPASLYIQKRTGGTWSTGLGQISGDYSISALALYHYRDWNILALILEGSYVRLARAVYGDGGDYAVGTFSGFEFINSYKSLVDFTGPLHLRQFRTGRAGRNVATYYEQFSAVQQMQASDTLGVDDPYLTYSAALGPVYSFSKNSLPWFFRLRPGTYFKDSDWYKAFPLDTTATCGLSLACDGAYLYAAAPNQVWRTELPSSWTPPVAGAGAGANFTIPSTHVLAVREQVKACAAGSLEVVLDNSTGLYNTIGSGVDTLAASIKRGSQITLSIGYHTTSDLLSVAGKYYIEAFEYARAPGRAIFTLHCIDAWALLERFTFNKPVEWNAQASEKTVYEIIELLVKSVGGSLSWQFRSNYMTSLIYPCISIHAGQSAASVLRQVLDLVPDSIFFVGLTGYIRFPQAADPPSYFLRFPS